MKPNINMDHNHSTGNYKADLILSVGSIMFAAVATATGNDLPVQAKWLAWALAIIASSITIYNNTKLKRRK